MPWAATTLRLVSAMALQGCVDAIIIGGVATGIFLAADRRQAEVMLADQRIEFTASHRVGEALKAQGHANVTSYNSMVLLPGAAPTPQATAAAETIAPQLPHLNTP